MYQHLLWTFRYNVEKHLQIVFPFVGKVKKKLTIAIQYTIIVLFYFIFVGHNFTK